MKVQEIAGSAAPEGYARGGLHRCPVPMGPLYVYKRLEGRVYLFQVRTPIVSGIHPNKVHHIIFSKGQLTAMGMVQHFPSPSRNRMVFSTMSDVRLPLSLRVYRLLEPTASAAILVLAVDTRWEDLFTWK